MTIHLSQQFNTSMIGASNNNKHIKSGEIHMPESYGTSILTKHLCCSQLLSHHALFRSFFSSNYIIMI